MFMLSIIIPVRNESDNLEHIMDHYSKNLRSLDYEVLIINDFSKDNTLEKAKSLSGKGQPILIIMKTEMGNGVDYMMGSHRWHGIAPNDEQLEIAVSQNKETLGDY